MSQESSSNLQLPVITIIARSNGPGLVNKNSIILLDGKVINGMSSFNLEMDGEDPTGLPTVTLSLKAYVRVVQEQSKETGEDESSE